MLLLVGLGNPGDKYAGHRHNVGFMAVDAIGELHGFGASKTKFQGHTREGFLETPSGRAKALLLKPQTYMNESGQSVGEAMRFYKIAPENVIVFYDELDLAPGKLRIKTGGGAAGHNGIRSIDAHIGNNFRRVRIGIGHPGDRSRVTSHVLGDFAKADRSWLEPMLDAIAKAAPLLALDDSNRFATEVAQQLAPPRQGKKDSKAGDEKKNNAQQKSSREQNGNDKPSPTNPFAEALRNLTGKKE